MPIIRFLYRFHKSWQKTSKLEKEQKIYFLVKCCAQIGLRKTQRWDSESSTDIDLHTQRLRHEKWTERAREGLWTTLWSEWSQRGRWCVAGADRGSDTNSFCRGCVENRRPKISIRWQKNICFSGLGKERRMPRATSRPLHQRIHLSYWNPSFAFVGLARHDTSWPWVECTSRSKIVSSRDVSCFRSTCFLFNVKAHVAPRAAA